MNTPYLYDTSCYDCYNCTGQYDAFCLSQCYRCNEVVSYNPFPYQNYPRYSRFGYAALSQPTLWYSPRNFSRANYFGGYPLPSLTYY